MSRTRRNFSAMFKSDLVLEVLKREKEPNVITTENNIRLISSGTGRRNSLRKLLWSLTTPGRRT